MARKRSARNPGPQAKQIETLAPHLLGTMFDTTRLLERRLSTGAVVRLRVEELQDGLVMVHEAHRSRSDGEWTRWDEVEGIQRAQDLRIDLCSEVAGATGCAG